HFIESNRHGPLAGESACYLQATRQPKPPRATRPGPPPGRRPQEGPRLAWPPCLSVWRALIIPAAPRASDGNATILLTPRLSAYPARIPASTRSQNLMKALRDALKVSPLVLVLGAWPAGADTVRVYVTNSAGDSIHVIDPATNKVVQVIKGIEAAHGIGFAPDGSKVYVSDEADS